jgi:hypothetical protein
MLAFISGPPAVWNNVKIIAKPARRRKAPWKPLGRRTRRFLDWSILISCRIFERILLGRCE